MLRMLMLKTYWKPTASSIEFESIEWHSCGIELPHLELLFAVGS